MGVVTELSTLMMEHPGSTKVYLSINTRRGQQNYRLPCGVDPSPEFYRAAKVILETKRPRRKRKQSYASYLRSDHWRQMRAKALSYYGDSCCLCDAKQRLEVHHRSYARLGRERMADLTVLCRSCHAKFHGKRV